MVIIGHLNPSLGHRAVSCVCETTMVAAIYIKMMTSTVLIIETSFGFK